MYDLCACMYFCALLVCLVSTEAKKEGTTSSGTGVTNSYELSGDCWESNPGSPEELPVHLTSESYLYTPPMSTILFTACGPTLSKLGQFSCALVSYSIRQINSSCF